MKDIIKLDSRFVVNYLEKVKDNSYLLKSEFDTMRAGNTQEGNYFIDPSGGPMIIEGKLLKEADAIVKYITWEKGVGYIITFE